MASNSMMRSRRRLLSSNSMMRRSFSLRMSARSSAISTNCCLRRFSLKEMSGSSSLVSSSLCSMMVTKLISVAVVSLSDSGWSSMMPGSSSMMSLPWEAVVAVVEGVELPFGEHLSNGHLELDPGDVALPWMVISIAVMLEICPKHITILIIGIGMVEVDLPSEPEGRRERHEFGLGEPSVGGGAHAELFDRWLDDVYGWCCLGLHHVDDASCAGGARGCCAGSWAKMAT
eukprot:16436124-Heterocapsa_arctica.AAC.1